MIVIFTTKKWDLRMENMFAKELWEYDKNKLSIGESMGYFCLTVWESEFKKNPEIIIEKIKKFSK